MNHYYRGIIIVYPHGSLIASGEKKLLVKSKKFESVLGKPLLLIQRKMALGIIRLTNIKEINLDEFRKKSDEHLITEYEREKWWPGKTILYQYDIRRSNIFPTPFQIKYPNGPQVFVNPENIKSVQHIYIGTSGYDYDWWKPYYESVSEDSESKIELYENQFNSLELNGSFYKMYKKHVWIRLKNSVGKNFIFSVKVNRSITQFRQFQKFNTFWSSVKHLLPKLKCLLFQFPKNFKYNEHSMHFLQNLDVPIRAAFEFRDREWFQENVYQLFRHKKWSLVISYTIGWQDYNLADRFNPPLVDWKPTSDFIYFRMHGSTGKYTGSHKHIIKGLIQYIRETGIKNVFVYFNNTDSLHSGNIPDAVYDAKYLQYKIGF